LTMAVMAMLRAETAFRLWGAKLKKNNLEG